MASPRPSRIRLFLPADRRRPQRAHRCRCARPGVDAVLPVSSDAGPDRLPLHGTRRLERRLGRRPTAPGCAARRRRRACRPRRSSRPPAWSNGALYTIDRSGTGGGSTGSRSTARPRAVAGARRLPARPRAAAGSPSRPTSPTPTWSPAAPGSCSTRPATPRRVALFTDGSRRPLIIHKSSAVDVSAAGGAEALTRSNLDPSNEHGQARDRAASPSPAAGAPDQQLSRLQDAPTRSRTSRSWARPRPGSRSVALQLDLPDARPAGLRARRPTSSRSSRSAPARRAAGSRSRVQGQTGAEPHRPVPETQYDVTVTAYINGQGTHVAPRSGSPPGPRGRPRRRTCGVAPTRHGNWTSDLGRLRRRRATGACPRPVWRVVPSFCDGRGPVRPRRPRSTSPPTRRRVAASRPDLPRQRRPARARPAVPGRGHRRRRARPARRRRRSGCVYSWTPPVAADICRAGQQPADHRSTDSTTRHHRHGPVRDRPGRTTSAASAAR